MEFANRCGKITVELKDDFTARGYIDGKLVIRSTIFDKVTPKKLVSSFWVVEKSDETYTKKTKAHCMDGGDLVIVKLEKQKVKVIKNAHKEFMREYGVTPTQFLKVYNAAVYKSAIVPYKEFQTLFFGKNHINKGTFKQVVENHDILLQALQDGQKNLLPFVSKGVTPQQGKSMYGKGQWKKFCANTLHRNKLITKDVDWVESDKYDSTALTLPSPEASHWVKHFCGVPYSELQKKSPRNSAAHLLVNIYTDTKNMARQYEMPFNPKWSKRKMEEKHEEYSNFAQLRYETHRRQQDEKYRLRMEVLEQIDLKDFYPKTEFTHKGVVARILTTYKGVKEEGTRMHHCVGSYAEQAMEKKYVVVHLYGPDEETTLGLYVDHVSGLKRYNFTFSQHYGKSNAQVKSEANKEMAQLVAKALNSMKFKDVE